MLRWLFGGGGYDAQNLVDAAFDGDEIGVWKSLEAGAPIRAQNGSGNTALHIRLVHIVRCQHSVRS